MSLGVKGLNSQFVVVRVLYRIEHRPIDSARLGGHDSGTHSAPTRVRSLFTVLATLVSPLHRDRFVPSLHTRSSHGRSGDIAICFTVIGKTIFLAEYWIRLIHSPVQTGNNVL